jgi:hypothetical protein
MGTLPASAAQFGAVEKKKSHPGFYPQSAAAPPRAGSLYGSVERRTRRIQIANQDLCQTEPFSQGQVHPAVMTAPTRGVSLVNPGIKPMNSNDPPENGKQNS